MLGSCPQEKTCKHPQWLQTSGFEVPMRDLESRRSYIFMRRAVSLMLTTTQGTTWCIHYWRGAYITDVGVYAHATHSWQARCRHLRILYRKWHVWNIWGYILGGSVVELSPHSQKVLGSIPAWAQVGYLVQKKGLSLWSLFSLCSLGFLHI